LSDIKPNFLIVGAAKAGTTALYYYLKQHNNIAFPELKEPKYFSSTSVRLPHAGVGDKSVDKHTITEWQEYLKIFEGFNGYKRVGEASPNYLYYHEKSAPLIKSKLGDIPIIIMLRHPVRRAFSAYSYLKRDSRENLTFRKALNKEKSRLEDNWDFIWGYKAASTYSYALETYISLFTNVKIVLFEEFIANPLNETNRVCEFLGLEPLDSLHIVKHNSSGVPTNRLTKLILNRNNNFSTCIREWLKSNVSRSLLETVSNATLRNMSISAEDYRFLSENLKDEIARTETVIDRNLGIWKMQ